MVLVSDPGQQPAVSQAALRALYGLSPAEARVALALLRGRSVAQAADELCLSLHTVRNHLKPIFLKTATTRQAELAGSRS